MDAVQNPSPAELRLPLEFSEDYARRRLLTSPFFLLESRFNQNPQNSSDSPKES